MLSFYCGCQELFLYDLKSGKCGTQGGLATGMLERFLSFLFYRWRCTHTTPLWHIFCDADLKTRACTDTTPLCIFCDADLKNPCLYRHNATEYVTQVWRTLSVPTQRHWVCDAGLKNPCLYRHTPLCTSCDVGVNNPCLYWHNAAVCLLWCRSEESVPVPTRPAGSSLTTAEPILSQCEQDSREAGAQKIRHDH